MSKTAIAVNSIRSKLEKKFTNLATLTTNLKRELNLVVAFKK
jgi:hypothetical protein